jgi:hypothetical protein
MAAARKDVHGIHRQAVFVVFEKNENRQGAIGRPQVS